jgi:hypothetical protein
MLIQFTKPENLDGAILIQELENNKIKIDKTTSPFVDGENNFWLDINQKDEEKAKEIVSNHGKHF